MGRGSFIQDRARSTGWSGFLVCLGFYAQHFETAVIFFFSANGIAVTELLDTVLYGSTAYRLRSVRRRGTRHIPPFLWG